ncbi:hypothetical protein [Deinococcus maricopensis]|uniref:Uncharacterized protein n=1 Tax=Deinococcus maricopensis (strain DSM 21211 / LMG 22137 / NRRL B-23946 / LB-34) TaxID=709986 RepID=E8U9L1_DEIML|nr:hypothetical protein [Deinococcus maricopensis]ADV67750.1 hypothetical protein Deima_2107 [Deinococcus maricopensis DSM 21211]
MRRPSALLLAALLTACAPATTAWPTLSPYSGALTDRPADAPDVLLLSVSGRCAGLCPTAPGDNWDYLTPRGTVGAVADALRAEGLSVQAEGFSAHLTAHTSSLSGREERGFLQLEDALVRAHETLMRGRRHPTRVVLLAHSHGTVWTHQLTRLHPEVTFDAVIDLDSVCDLWERDNAAAVRAFVRGPGTGRWPFDPSNPCGSVLVGPARLDVKDVVFPNVHANLEVQSQRLVGRSTEPAVGPFGANFPFDLVRNVRFDGTRTGIQTYRSGTENHSRVTYPGGPSMTWVVSRVRELARAWALDNAQ